MAPTEVGKENASKRNVLIAGVTAGLFSRFVIAPLDVVKIRLQLQSRDVEVIDRSFASRKGPAYRGMAQTMRTIFAEEGIRGLWKGNIPAELLYMTYGAAQFLAYREASVLISTLPYKINDTSKSFVAGAIAGGVATLATYPLDLLRTRFAAQGSEKIYRSLFHSVQQIYQHEGVLGFYRGAGAGVAQIVPYMGIFFCTYEASKTYLSVPHLDRQLPVGWSEAAAGGFAATVGKTCVFPLDLIRKRLQVQGPTREKYVHRNIPVYKGINSAAIDIFRHEGLRGLYKGLTVSLVKAAPLSAVTMWSFEESLKLLEWFDRQSVEL